MTDKGYMDVVGSMGIELRYVGEARKGDKLCSWEGTVFILNPDYPPRYVYLGEIVELGPITHEELMRRVRR